LIKIVAIGKSYLNSDSYLFQIAFQYDKPVRLMRATPLATALTPAEADCSN
jgi:hypothetical protein